MELAVQYPADVLGSDPEMLRGFAQAAEAAGYARLVMAEHVLGADEYFVMGDHRRVSVDSRDFGPVQGEQILGRVVLRMAGPSLQAVAALDDLGVTEQG